MIQIMRHVVINLVIHHPIAVLRIILIRGPTRVVTTVIKVFSSAPNQIWMLLILVGGLAVAAVQAITGCLPPIRDVRATILLGVAAALLAAAINTIAYAAPHTISDLLLSLLILLQIAVWGAATSIIGYIRPSLRLQKQVVTDEPHGFSSDAATAYSRCEVSRW